MNPIPKIENGQIVYNPMYFQNKTMELSATIDSFYTLSYPTSATSLSSESSSSSEEKAVESNEKQRKQKHLEKNKLAAWKCRQRKKLWIEELTKKAERLTRENSNLKNMVRLLRDETMYLKNQLLSYKQRGPYPRLS